MIETRNSRRGAGQAGAPPPPVVPPGMLLPSTVLPGALLPGALRSLLPAIFSVYDDFQTPSINRAFTLTVFPIRSPGIA